MVRQLHPFRLSSGNLRSSLRGCGYTRRSEGNSVKPIKARFVGVELYFVDLERAKRFYVDTLDLKISDEQPGHYAKFDSGAGFVCLELKGVESYPSVDKAVLFFEVPDLKTAVATIGEKWLVHAESAWAAMHDPEGHNIILLQRSQ